MKCAVILRVIRRLLFYGRSLLCINAIRGGTVFTKFKVKYGARDRGVLKGTFHLVGNTTSLFLRLIFFAFTKRRA